VIKLAAWLRRPFWRSTFLRDARGAATMEFVVIFPFVVFIIFMFIEMGLLQARTTLLKRGLDIAGRDVRLGITDSRYQRETETEEQRFRRFVCADAFMGQGCVDNLHIEIVREGSPGFTDPQIKCRDTTTDPDEFEPILEFQPNQSNQIVLIKACLVARPFIPGSAFGAALRFYQGVGYVILAKTAVMVEPAG